jgi:CelD/BcsL family acetyltransferase involved in cellulose biosynthesis
MQNRIAVAPLQGSRATEARRSPRAPFALEPFATPIATKSAIFADALPQWRRLDAPPILTPEFFLATARLTREAEPLLVCARRGPALVLALPLARQGRTLRALRGEHTPRIDVVGDPIALPTLWRAVREVGAWDVIELEAVPADSPLAVMLPALAREDGCEVFVRETHRAPWFAVEDIDQHIHRRFRGDMRRLERQLGGVELERVATFQREAVSDVLRLEAAAWKGAAGTAISCDPRLAIFYATLARLLARKNALSITFLRAKGRRIAAQFGLEDRTTYFLLKTGYDPDYAHFGPGQLLVRETAIDCARRGLVRFDMMGKATPWKMKWTDQSRAHVRVTIYSGSPLGRARRFAQEVARPLAGRALRGLRAARGRYGPAGAEHA